MSFREQSSLILFATLFTLLIWLWAEGENRASRSLDLVLQFTCESDTDPFLLRLRDPEDPGQLLNEIEITIELEGPNLPLTRFARDRTSLRVNLPTPLDGEEREVDLIGAIQGLADIDDVGLTVLGTSPRTLTARFDQLTTRAVPIARTVPGYDFESIVVVPDQVDITLPDVTWPTLAGDLVHLDLSAASLGTLAPGESRTFDQVPLRLDERVRTVEGLQFQSVPVSVTLQLIDRTVELEISTVPVWVSTHPRDEQAYDVIIEIKDEVIQNVTVSGDSAQIDLLKSGSVSVYAMLYLTSEDLERGITSKAVEWILPEGLSVIKVGDSTIVAHEVEIDIVKRSADS